MTLTVIGAGNAMAQNDNWDGGAGSGLWATSNNWIDDSAPSGTMGILTFNGGTQTVMNNDITGISVSSLDFTNNGLSNTAAFTLSGSSITLLTQSNAVKTSVIAGGGTAITDTLSLDLIATGIRQFNIGLGHDLIFSGGLGGSGASLSKGGQGTLTVSGNNSYTGLTYVDSGILKLGASNVLPANLEVKRGNTTDSNPTLDLSGFSDTIGAINFGHSTTTALNSGGQPSVINTGNSSAILTLGGNITYRSGTASFLNGQATISANIATGNAARNISVGDGAATDDLVISGGISGSGTVTKQGAGVLLLSGANSYTGQVNIQEGKLKLGANNTLPDALTNIVQLGINSSTVAVVLDINGVSDTVGPLKINGAGGTNNPSASGLTHSIIDSAGGGVLTLGNTFNVYAGATNQYGQATISANLNTGAVDRNFFVENSSTAAIDLLISGVITGIGNGFNMAGAGTVVLSNANTFSGDTRTGLGVLRLQSNLALQNSALNAAALTTGILTLDPEITAPILGGLKGARDIRDVITSGYGSVTSLTLNPNSGSVSYDGEISDGATSMSVTKTGAGSQVFTNVSSYTGTTNVNNGTLVVNGNISTSSLTTVNAGGTLSGTGTVGMATVVANGTLAPGNSLGTLNFSNTLTLAGISNFDVDPLLGLGLNANRANVTHGITYGGTLNVLYAGASSNFESGMVFNLFDASSFSGSFGTVNLPSLADGLTWQNDLASNGSLMVIPEPSASSLLVSIGMLALLRRRRD